MNDPLFELIRINHLEIKNRICMPVLRPNMYWNIKTADRFKELLSEVAWGGAGIIFVGRMAGHGPSLRTQHLDIYGAELLGIVETIRENSGVAMAVLGQTDCRPTSNKDMTSLNSNEITDGCVRAAKGLKTAGFAGIEVWVEIRKPEIRYSDITRDGGKKSFNEIPDAYLNLYPGVLKEIRKVVGNNYPLGCRLNVGKFMQGHMGKELVIKLTLALAESGADFLNIEGDRSIQSECWGEYAEILEAIRSNVNLITIATNGIVNVNLARYLIGNKMCDMVSMGSALIADPYLPEKTCLGYSGLSESNALK